MHRRQIYARSLSDIDSSPGPRYGVVEGLVLIAVRLVALSDVSAGAFKPVIWIISLYRWATAATVDFLPPNGGTL